MSEITFRIREVFESTQKTQSDFARELNVTPAYVWKLLNKNDAVPSDRLIEDICEKFNVNEEWLRTGKGEMFKELDREQEIAAMTVMLFKEEQSSFKYRLISALSKMDDNGWKALEQLAKEITDKKD